MKNNFFHSFPYLEEKFIIGQTVGIKIRKVPLVFVEKLRSFVILKESRINFFEGFSLDCAHAQSFYQMKLCKVETKKMNDQSIYENNIKMKINIYLRNMVS